MTSTSPRSSFFLAAVALLATAGASVARAQYPAPAPYQPSSATYAQTGAGPDQPLPPAPAPAAALAQPLNQLVAPIALYPDPLVALILPAASNVGQIVSAATYLANGGNPDAAPWEDSVRSLAHYPQIIQWMAANQQWTQELGTAFATDPASVMAAIQTLRAVARSSGTLANTPQQVVVETDNQIEIEPAESDEIYVPSYDPSVVFVNRPYYGGGDYLAFGSPYAVGDWLDFGFNWEGRSLYYGDWRTWHNGGRWGHIEGRGAPPAGVRAWQGRAGVRATTSFQAAVVAPRAMVGAPPAPQRGHGSVTYQPSRPAGTIPASSAQYHTDVHAAPTRPQYEARPEVHPQSNLAPNREELERARQQAPAHPVYVERAERRESAPAATPAARASAPAPVHHEAPRPAAAAEPRDGRDQPR